MNVIFVDSDFIIDFLTMRKPFVEETQAIFQLAALKKIKICISSVTVVNVNYIIGRLESKDKALCKTEKLVKLVNILNVGDSTIKKALASNFKDFDDAVQNACAMQSKIDALITRNVKDYRKSTLSILTPKEFMVKMDLL